MLKLLAPLPDDVGEQAVDAAGRTAPAPARQTPGTATARSGGRPAPPRRALSSVRMSASGSSGSTACTAARHRGGQRTPARRRRCGRRTNTGRELDLVEREPQRRLGVEIGGVVLDVADDPDNLPFLAEHVDRRADGVALREVAVGQRLVDDQRQRLPDHVAPCDRTGARRAAACRALRSSRARRPDSGPRLGRLRLPSGARPTIAKPVFSS